MSVLTRVSTTKLIAGLSAFTGAMRGPPAALDGGAALDALLDGLLDAQAHGHWQGDPDSEARRLGLLPQTAPFTWDDLMHQPAYQRALERLP